mmetsp:Transcript_18809/g.43336  ORF Transcript_18809/g.43336 Transcript_18809/m.43336 type:complete len:134 (-) Transcript_18809:258-659(-)
MDVDDGQQQGVEVLPDQRWFWIDRSIERWMDGSMDGSTDRPIDHLFPSQYCPPTFVLTSKTSMRLRVASVRAEQGRKQLPLLLFSTSAISMSQSTSHSGTASTSGRDRIAALSPTTTTTKNQGLTGVHLRYSN